MISATNNKQPLVLIDANALIHRAYHALPPLTTREGAVVHAAYGFTSVLLKVIDDLQPAFMVAAFDVPAPTFRDELFEDYKAHRPTTPDDLVEQIVYVREILETLDIPILEHEGFEADDIIGTVAEQFRGHDDLRVVIVTGDLDTLQLVGDNVAVYTFRRGMSDTTIYNTDAVQERYGLPPGRLADYKGLVGDPSDNIPGVPGVGDKTATALLQEFSDIEKMYETMETTPDDERIPTRARTSLQKHKDQAFMSKELATIRLDAPVSITLDQARWGTYDRTAVEEMFRRFEFRSLLGRFSTLSASDTSLDDERESLPPEVVSVSRLLSFIEATPIAVLPVHDNAKPVPKMEHIVVERDDGQCVRLEGLNKQEWQDVLAVLADHPEQIVVHHGKPLWRYWRANDIAFPTHVHDTMLAAYLLHPQDGDYPSERLLQEHNVPTLLQVADRQRRQLQDDDLLMLLDAVEMPTSFCLAAMEVQGIRVDSSVLVDARQEAQEHLRRLEEEIYGHAGRPFTVNSPQQLSSVLFEELSLPTTGLKKTSTGMVSTAESELTKIKESHPVVALVLSYRSLAKAVSTYIDPLPQAVHPQSGRIHTTFHQTTTATGRLSSSDPNLQNIPIHGGLADTIRSVFLPSEEFEFVAFDYSQMELRLAAVIADDTAMKQAFERGEDIHTRTAADVLDERPDDITAEQRRLAKVLNFGVLYGMSAHGFAEAAAISHGQAQMFIDRYLQEFSGIARYRDDVVRRAREQGYVQTLLGRRRPLPEIRSSNYQVREAAKRMAINMPIQGSEADLLKIAMVRIDERLKKEGVDTEARLLLQLHDELLFEIHPHVIDRSIPLIRDIMRNIRSDRLVEERDVHIDVALEVDVKKGVSWATMEKM